VNLDVKDPVLARTLLDLSQTATINDSLKLGKAVLGELGDINHLHKASVEQAGFAVLKAPDIPRSWWRRRSSPIPRRSCGLKDSAYQEKMADAILQGLRNYLPRTRRSRAPASLRTPEAEPLAPQAAVRPPAPLACARSIAEASSAVRGFEKR